MVAAAQVSSTLPSSLSFELNLPGKQGKLTGTTPKEGGSWTIVYNLLDNNKCLVIRLTVRISTTAAAQCPQVQALRWDFGEVQVGTHTFTARSLSSDIVSKIKSAGIVKATKVSSNLPSGADLSLDLNTGLAILTGNLPTAGQSYEVVFGLYDAKNCEIYRLTVTLRTAQAAAAPLSVFIQRVNVEKVCGSDYSHALTVYWQASGGQAPVHVGPLAIVYPDGRTQMLMGTFPATGSATLRVNLASGGKVKVRVQANDSAGQTKTAEQEVNLEACIQIGIIVPLNYTLEVYARTPINVTPGYKELRVPVQIVGESSSRTTPFSVSVRAGTKITLEVPYSTPDRSYRFKRFEVYVGSATTPTVYAGTYDAKRGIYSLTLTMTQNIKVVAVYEVYVW